MTSQERFLNTMCFKSVDRTPFWMPWWWDETNEKWEQESGRIINEANEERRFGCDHKEHIRMWLNFEPPFEEKIVHEDEEFVTMCTKRGVIQKGLKKHRKSSVEMPIQYPIYDRKDYFKYRIRLTGHVEERLAKIENFDRHKNRDYVASLRGSLDCGFYGPLRELVGFDRLNYLFYDDPALIEMMMDDRADLILQMIDEILKKTSIDWFCFWEDMAYKNGPMISPEMFRKFLMPRYLKINDFLHKNGIDLIFVDSDGDINQLIPLWLECGVNGMFPLEVQAGMDVVKLRKEYGKDLLMCGGLDKREMTKGRNEIEYEILKKVPSLIKEGGYIPRPDHEIPPDVSYDNYSYYMDFLKFILEKGSFF